jgi:phage terminase large subunit-like protein
MARSTPPAWAIRTKADRRALDDGYYWDQAAAEKIVRFAEAYVAVKYSAEEAGQFKLFQWQRRFLMSLYGWRRADGSRRFKLVLLHVPKKNGKTLLVSIIALFELLGAGVVAPLVVSASTTKENAKQVYEQLLACIRRSPKLAAVCRPTEFRKLIRVPDRDGEYRALSADASNAEGLNCSAVIVDEAHAHRSPRLYRTLEYAMIGRPDGFMVVISTAGDDLTHWYYGLVERGRRHVAGDDLDPTFYAEVYEADPDKDDLDDPEVWRRVNPSMDQYEGFTAESFGLLWEAKKQRTGDRLSFERYRFNIFRRPEETTWIDLVRWDACRGEVPSPEELRSLDCFLGLDASQRIDPTSISAVWPRPGRRFFVRSWAWVAEAGVREREKTNLPRYQQFVAEGSMIVTAGDVIDKSAVLGQLRYMVGLGNVKALVMDPNGAWVVGQDLDGDLGGERIFRQPQTHRWFTGRVRELQTAVIERRVTHDGSAWARWCIHSARLDTDPHKNVRLVKAKSVDHIDGAIALLMPFALADAAASAPPATPAIFLV